MISTQSTVLAGRAVAPRAAARRTAARTTAVKVQARDAPWCPGTEAPAYLNGTLPGCVTSGLASPCSRETRVAMRKAGAPVAVAERPMKPERIMEVSQRCWAARSFSDAAFRVRAVVLGPQKISRIKWEVPEL